MGTLGWILVIAVALALGFSLGQLRSKSAGKIAELERERDAAKEELGNYRREVDTHFERTAELFDKVTDDYRKLYDHLALSARQLGAIRGESAEVPLARPEQRRLALGDDGAVAPAPETEPGPDTDSAPEPEAAPESEAEQKPGRGQASPGASKAEPESEPEPEPERESGLKP